VLQLMRRICQEQQDQLQRFWVDPADVKVQELLGHGSSGQVYSGTLKGRPAAIKVLNLPAGAAAATAGGLSALLQSSGRLAAALRQELCVMARAQEFDSVCRCGLAGGHGVQVAGPVLL
jgi:hypothetical protein